MTLRNGKSKYKILGAEFSCIYRDDVVYINLSEAAAFRDSPTEKGSIVRCWIKSKKTASLIAEAELAVWGKTSIRHSLPFSMDVYSDELSVIVERGRNGGIYALKWIFLKFVDHLFPGIIKSEFYLDDLSFEDIKKPAPVNDYDEAFRFNISCIKRNGRRMINLCDLAGIKPLKEFCSKSAYMTARRWIKSKKAIEIIRHGYPKDYGKRCVRALEKIYIKIRPDARPVVRVHGAGGGIYAQEWLAFEFLKHLFPRYKVKLSAILDEGVRSATGEVDLEAVLKLLLCTRDSFEHPAKLTTGKL